MKQTLKDSVLTSVATLSFIGRLPKAPGTWGSLAAVVAAPWLFIPFSVSTKILILIILFFAGSLACSAAEKMYGRKDPGQAVIDEVLGQWTVFLFISQASLSVLVLGFILFRIFDISKPFPIRRSERWLPGGYSVMLDDLLAGIYALLALILTVELLLKPFFPWLL
ncbi:MAG: phosphatidylglycerophosphatase A [Desulfonatronovibrio sp.]